MNVQLLLSHLGIKAERRGRKYVAVCPNPKHEDHAPSWSIIDQPGSDRHGSHFCFSCKFGGGPWELASAVWGCSVEEAGARLKTLFKTGEGKAIKSVPRVRIQNGTPSVKESHLPKGVVIPGPDGTWYEPALEYLQSRGISRELADYWGAGYAVWGRLRSRVVFPVYDRSGNVLNFSARSIIRSEPKRYLVGEGFYGMNPRRSLWGEHRWNLENPTITFVEGVFSGLAVAAAGAPNPTALLGSHFTEEKAVAVTLAGFKNVIVATDPDKAGDRVASSISVLERRLRLIRVKPRLSPDDMPLDELTDLIRVAKIGLSRRRRGSKID